MNFWTFLTGSAIGGGLIALLVFAIRTYIQHVTKGYFDKNIENHRHELTKALKEVEFDYQRRMEDFTLYTKKRHENYAELYKKLNKAVTEIGIATSAYRQYPDPRFFGEVNIEVLKETLSRYDFSEDEILSVYNKWSYDSQEGKNEINRRIDFKKLIKANKFRLEARIFFNDNELYLSNDISVKIGELVELMLTVVNEETTRIECPEDRDYANQTYKNHRENNIKLKEQLKEIKELMKEELSIGDY